ncbi:hypothetical protein MKZ38_000274 [Zalerion maritima]|uniref:Uncharacterized protein n=1 Tax=Zalerion maritima TaxID=339359 RepID=A0AAD5RTD5_9PEZI|nr:hypothetical protein MKZ38_000274 [Zalerion maritima]
MPQQLSSKEASLFRSVVRHYEEKQYKRGIKAADQILKKNPKHGDTTAMKALIMNQQGKTEDAFTLAKEALKMDMKSHVCWHVYGMLYRSNKNFEEAIKAYKFALRLEPESQQILRDLAILQVQMRDCAGYLQSRHQMLQARPQMRQMWTGLAIAYHLAGQLSEAENVLTSYEGTLKHSPPKTDIEHADAIMYKNDLISEQGDTQRALDHLEKNGKKNLDHLTVMERRAKYLFQLGRKDDAVKAYKALLDRNADHSVYYDELMKVLDIPGEDEAAKKAVFDEYAEKFPRCDAAKRLPLDFLTGNTFREQAKHYLTHMLNKGVPSTFANLKHLYSDDFKKDALLTLAEEYLAANQGEGKSGDVSKGKAAALYFIAQHYNYYLSQDLDKAMEYVDKAIEMDPKSVDFAMTKARIWKHRGNTQKASEAMDHARQLDTKDRYINSKGAKYQLRNNENETALKTMGLFTRQDAVGGPMADLLDMQCLWYLTEDGEAYARQGNIGMALKRFQSIYNIFEVWQEDQYDFHTFSLRKGQARAYIEMIRWEDNLREHTFYSRAALAAVDVYLSIHDKPVAEENQANGGDAVEKKKAVKKARKEQQRLEREAAEAAAKQDPNKGGQQQDAKKVDEDPLGLKLAATKEPLAEAMKYLTPLLQFSQKNVDSQIAGFDVFIRRKKYLMALRCLLAGFDLNPEHPRVHEQTVELRLALNKDQEIPERVLELVNAEFNVDAKTDIKKMNTEFWTKNQDSPDHVLSSIKAQKMLGDDMATCEEAVEELLSMDNVTFEVAGKALQTLRSWRSGQADAFRQAAHDKWPEVTLFA